MLHDRKVKFRVVVPVPEPELLAKYPDDNSNMWAGDAEAIALALSETFENVVIEYDTLKICDYCGDVIDSDSCDCFASSLADDQEISASKV